MWRVDRTFLFFLVSEPRAGARPSLQKLWRVDRTFLFFWGLNLEQVPGRAYRKCGEWIALFFFLGVWTSNRCQSELTEIVESGSHFSFFFWVGVWTWNRCFVEGRPRFSFFWVVWTSSRCQAELTENVEREGDRDRWLQLIDGNEGLAGLFFSCALKGQGEKKNKEIRTSAWPSLQKMWTFLFFLGRPHFSFFFGVWTSFFSFSLFSPLFPSLYPFFHLFTSFLTLFTSFSLFFHFLFLFLSFSLFFLFFFALFHIFFSFHHLFHIISFFFLFSLSFFAFFFAFSLAWPRPQPYLAFPYLTSHYISSPLKKKRSIEIFSRFLCWVRSSCPPKRLIISRSIHMSSCRRWIQIVIPNASCLWDVCVWSKHAPKSVQFFGTGVEVQRWSQKPSLSCACTRELLSDVGSFFLVFLVEQGEGCFFFFLLSP